MSSNNNDNLATEKELDTKSQINGGLGSSHGSPIFLASDAGMGNWFVLCNVFDYLKSESSVFGVTVAAESPRDAGLEGMSRICDKLNSEVPGSVFLSVNSVLGSFESVAGL